MRMHRYGAYACACARGIYVRICYINYAFDFICTCMRMRSASALQDRYPKYSKINFLKLPARHSAENA